MTSTHEQGERPNPQESVRGDKLNSAMQGGRQGSPLASPPTDRDTVTVCVSAEGDAQTDEASATRMVVLAIKEMVQIVVPAVTLALLIHFYLAQATIVHGQSMQPSFRPAERLVLEKLSYYFREPRRNEIVVLDLPESKALIIKRIVGLPGETVEIQQGQVSVDGRIVAPPHDITPRSQVVVDGDEVKAPPRYGDVPSVYGPITLETDSYFVLGDNRDNSNDSRAFGPVHRDFIKGRVWVRYWPLTRLFIFR